MSLVRNLVITAAVLGAGAVIKHTLAPPMSAKDIAAQAASQVQLPMRLNEEMSVRAISGYGDKLVFTYSLDNYELDTLDPALLHPDAQGELCTFIREAFRQARVDPDIEVTREYVNSYGHKLHTVTVPVSRCD